MTGKTAASSRNKMNKKNADRLGKKQGKTAVLAAGGARGAAKMGQRGASQADRPLFCLELGHSNARINGRVHPASTPQLRAHQVPWQVLTLRDMEVRLSPSRTVYLHSSTSNVTHRLLDSPMTLGRCQVTIRHNSGVLSQHRMVEKDFTCSRSTQSLPHHHSQGGGCSGKILLAIEARSLCRTVTPRWGGIDYARCRDGVLPELAIDIQARHGRCCGENHPICKAMPLGDGYFRFCIASRRGGGGGH